MVVADKTTSGQNPPIQLEVSMRLAILMLDGAMQSAAVGAADLLALSNAILAGQGRPPAFRWSYVAAGNLAVHTAGGQVFQADCDLDRFDDYDAVLIPGSIPLSSPPDKSDSRTTAKTWLRRTHARGAVIGASCGGVFLLAESGLLEGRKATTTWWLQSELKQRYPQIDLSRDAVVTESSRVLCGAGPMSWVDLLLRLIAATDGSNLAQLCADYAVIDTAGRTQSAYVPMAYMLQQDPLLVQADMLVRCSGESPMTVRNLAKALGLSERTLHRRILDLTGEPPQNFILRRRIDVARTLLETTGRAIKEIAHAVGYEDESSFRKTFRKITGYSPQTYRARRL